MTDVIRVTGARQHNLKNLSLSLPKNKLVVITGVSGSGKSSLAFDTLYAEGQRRYVESLSAYARQFLERWEKPDVDAIDGLAPAIAIEQRTSAPNPRSTVATTTEIYDYLRVLYAACGRPHDPATGAPLQRHTIPQIAADLQTLPEGTRLMILAPLPASELGEKGDLRPLVTRLQKTGFARLRIDGRVHELESFVAEHASGEEPWRFSPSTAPGVEIVIDRLAVRPDGTDRLIDSVRTALRWSRDEVWALIEERAPEAQPRWREQRFTTSFLNPATGYRLADLTPRHFSFNSHLGACPDCQGLGVQLDPDPERFVPDGSLSLAEGAVKSWWPGNPTMLALFKQEIDALAAHFRVARDVPFDDLPEAFRQALFHGTGGTAIKTGWKTSGTTRSVAKPFEGLVPQARRLHQTSESDSLKRQLARFLRGSRCQACGGRRLRPEILAVTLGSRAGNPPVSGGREHRATLACPKSASDWRGTASPVSPETGGLPGVPAIDFSTIERSQSWRLPHWEASGATYAVTFRLADSLPAAILEQWRHEREFLRTQADLATEQSPMRPEDRERLRFLESEAVNDYLDAGHGQCWLKQPPVARLVADALHHFDRARYDLLAWCVMPNHVHVVFRPRDEHAMSEIVTAWKKFTAREANKLLGRRGPFWQAESYDHIIRDSDELRRQIAYVLGNPRKAGLADWPWVGSSPPVSGGREAGAEHALPPPVGDRRATEALSIDAFCALTVSAARAWLGGLELAETQRLIATEPVREIAARLRFIEDVGLGYLSLDREMGTLSGGEAQRIRLATQIGSGLSGVLYVLDEPSIGLHQRDNERLIGTLRQLRDMGNTVLVVEHDEETIRAADWLVDLGPGAGPHGGEVLAAGPPDAVARDPRSLTGRYLSGERRVGEGARRREWLISAGHLTIHDAAEHNLQNLTVRFPIGLLTCVTGVSGSGKSTLVDDILRRALARRLHQARDTPGRHRDITGLEHFDKLVVVDQDPIGRSPRSNPVTYLGVFTEIRKLFAALPASRIRGFTAGTFSFNIKGGRCEACEGDGQLRIDMHFLADVFVTCESCGGRRYQRDVLDVTYKGKSIADVLDMSFEEATAFFRAVPQVSEKLRTVCRVGLGYLQPGQGANTLSGGEAQRLKLAAELAKRATGRTLYLLDEPTTGLHFQDIDVLLGVLFRLRDAGNTLIVIEHNLDVIRSADWILDLGPGGGAAGGRLVAEGPPDAIAACETSETGRFLRRSSKS